MSLFQVKQTKIIYRGTPSDGLSYTMKMDKSYDLMAKFYNGFMMLFPLWKKWISAVLPLLWGHKILEVSFGPGYLLEKCAAPYECHGIDFNQTMVEMAGRRLARKKLSASLIRGNVEALPYESDSFDSVINTMAFTGYPDGDKALEEMIRVVKPEGRLLIVDFDYPENRNFLGYAIAKFIDCSGDILKDIETQLGAQKVDFLRQSIGAFGSVNLYIVTKKGRSIENS
jgi:ubiquinone/menaquinone biosynthesis C-methylase UbiE